MASRVEHNWMRKYYNLSENAFGDFPSNLGPMLRCRYQDDLHIFRFFLEQTPKPVADFYPNCVLELSEENAFIGLKGFYDAERKKYSFIMHSPNLNEILEENRIRLRRFSSGIASTSIRAKMTLIHGQIIYSVDQCHACNEDCIIVEIVLVQVRELMLRGYKLLLCVEVINKLRRTSQQNRVVKILNQVVTIIENEKDSMKWNSHSFKSFVQRIDEQYNEGRSQTGFCL